VVTGDHCLDRLEACTSKAIPFQDWTRNAPAPRHLEPARGSLEPSDCGTSQTFGAPETNRTQERAQSRMAEIYFEARTR